MVVWCIGVRCLERVFPRLQVPGDGNCLFHAISACLDYACNGTHPSLDLNELMPKSAGLRKVREKVEEDEK